MTKVIFQNWNNPYFTPENCLTGWISTRKFSQFVPRYGTNLCLHKCFAWILSLQPPTLNTLLAPTSTDFYICLSMWHGWSHVLKLGESVRVQTNNSHPMNCCVFWKMIQKVYFWSTKCLSGFSWFYIFWIETLETIKGTFKEWQFQKVVFPIFVYVIDKTQRDPCAHFAVQNFSFICPKWQSKQTPWSSHVWYLFIWNHSLT